MTSQGAEDEITNVCGQEKQKLILRQSESNKNILVNFNYVHTMRDSSLSSSETSWSYIKKMFLEISQNSQESTCDSVSFLIKLRASGLDLSVFL